jgi:hypothetical protein
MIDCQHFDCEATLFRHHVDWISVRDAPCAVFYVAARLVQWDDLVTDARLETTLGGDLPDSATEKDHARFTRLVAKLVEQFPCIHNVGEFRKLPDKSSWDRPGTVMRVQTNYSKGNINKYDIEIWGISRIYSP